jgi:predicted dienelactone hydrolase
LCNAIALVAAICALGCESSNEPSGDGTEENGGHGPQQGDGVESIIRGGKRGHDDAGELLDGGSKPSHEQPGENTDSSPMMRDDGGNTPVVMHESNGGAAQASNPMDGGEMLPPARELVVSDDPGVDGPWPVGVRTVMLTIGSRQTMPVEVWYPAVPGSEAGKPKVVYDLAQWLPPEAIKQMPASAVPVPRECNCYRDLPIDQEHGPYPASIFVHNVAAFRVGSSGMLAHWASRGFIALAADHPDETIGDWCADNSRGRCTGSGISADTTHTRDLPAMLESLRDPKDEMAFLAGAVDAQHMSVTGHSEGAGYAAATSGEAGVRLIMILNSSQAVTKRGDLGAVLYLSSKSDNLLGSDPATIEDMFWNVANDINPAYYVSVANAGHLSVTSFCNSKNKAGQTGMDLGTTYGLCGIDFTPLRLVWDCNASYLPQDKADLVFGYVTSTALEAVLLGKDRSAAWAQFKSTWGDTKQVQ